MTTNSNRQPAVMPGLSKAPARHVKPTEISRSERESGDQVNRFLLCSLVSASAKQIKASAQRSGESIAMTSIVRAVLRSYRMAAKDKDGPFADPEVDISRLTGLNKRVLDDEVARQLTVRSGNVEANASSAERGARIGPGNPAALGQPARLVEGRRF
jgi:hypothetical protein